MKLRTATLTTLSLAAAFACASLPPAHAAPGLPSPNVAWLPAAADADVERAFASARSAKKPVLLYWGATWCPPCNQLKATLFNRQDFAELSRHFVAVHVDGDRPGAQKLGSRFKVSGYPTMVLFGPDGQEITRLPGEADAPQVMAVLQAGLAAGRPAKALLAEALKGQALSANEWRSLAFYSWDTDEQQLVTKSELPGTLARLAATCPAADEATADRLWLKALAASDDGKGVKPDAGLRERVLRVLADPARARALMDVISNGADDIVRTLDAEATPGRMQAVAAFETALRRFEGDATLSRNDRLGALYARVLLARLDQPKEAVQVTLPEPLIQQVRDHVARVDREITDGYERQAVITFAAALLGRAGLWAESESLLKSNLSKSHSPYYLMSQLGSNARKLGRAEEALAWYAQSFDKSEGPATRLQWGSGYLGALVDLAPEDARRIEKTAGQLLAEAQRDKGAFEGRSVRSLQRMSSKLLAWSGDKAPQRAVLRRLQAQLDGICPKVDTADGQRAACQALLKPSAKKTS
ncbi:MAG TPA: thioredoxin family protein [Rubrivivax sp.]|nr:thioredoxin family protein [Rubrivivax sp.]